MAVVSFSSSNLIQNYVSSVNATPTAKPEVQAQSQENASRTEVMPKETADAMKAYAMVQKPENNIGAKSLPDLKSDLINQGKEEGKDFEIVQDDLTSSITYIEDEKPVKTLRYANAGSSDKDLECIEEISYPVLEEEKGLKKVSAFYGPEGDFRCRTFTYEKDKSPYEDEFVNFKTTTSEFASHLKDENIKFGIDYDFIGSCKLSKFTVFEDDKVNKYEFLTDKDNKNLSVSKSTIGDNGNVKNTITFDEDTTSYTEYEDNFNV